MKGVFLDTSILLEHFKGNPKAKDILLRLMDSDVVLFINPIVFSEVVYLLLGFYSGISPRSLKGKPEKLPQKIDLVFEALEEYAFVELGEKTSHIAKDLNPQIRHAPERRPNPCHLHGARLFPCDPR